MKRYPRIKRLSTLGIVHHQSFDYDFNPFRTDFVGEGGSGKSMVVDILQLIFVGSVAFHSPTESSEPRKPKTMVLRTAGKGTDMGYAFVNIEINKGAFLVVGIYLESTGNSQSFIVQEGNSFEPEDELVPFNQTLSFSDFLQEDTILPLDDLKNHIFDTKGYVCESWTRLKKFHKLLFENYIIPVDLSANQEALKSYAKIIQAFSRESLDIKKSDRIQEFLFGSDKEKEFYEDFNKAIDELSGDIKQFESNKDEIELLTHKQTELQELLNLKAERDEAKEEYLTTKYHYLKHQLTWHKLQIVERLDALHNNRINLEGLKNLAESTAKNLNEKTQELDTKFQTALKNKTVWENKNDALKKFFSWMQSFEKTGQELLEHYNKYHSNKLDIERINHLESLMKQEGIYTFFKEGDKLNKNAWICIATTISDLESSLETKKKLVVLNNLDDATSLAYWALSLNRKLSLNEESVIHKYQNDNITTQEPISTIDARYIPDPKTLIENLPIAKKDDDGFWLNLGGIWEYIPLVKEPIFNTGSSDKIKEYFTGQKVSIEKDIKNLEYELKNWQSLRELLNGLENPSEHLKSWESKNENMDFGKHDLFDESPDSIKKYLQLLDEDEQIDEGLKKSTSAFNKIDKKRTNHNSLISVLEASAKAIAIPVIDEKIKEVIAKYDYKEKKSDGFKNIKSGIIESEDFHQSFIVALQEENKNIVTFEELEAIDKKIEKLNLVLDELVKDNPDWNNEVDNSKEIITSELLENINIKYSSCQKQYSIKYDLVVKEFLKQKENRYLGTDDFRQICSEILPPEIFSEDDLKDDEIIPHIRKLLEDINLKNKRLNIRKLQKLTGIIDKVNNEVSEQIYYSKKIRDFIDSEDKTITGGHRAKLSISFENSYPREWMEKFIEEIRKDIKVSSDSNLFESLQGISNDLEKYTSLEEKMQEAFYRCGGSRNLKPKVWELLNPKSYYDLNFSIQSLHGKRNPGSTSQTYAAIALLCISRLSLINRVSRDKIRDGIRFMPIDEAAGLGSNFDMLYDIAKANDYQIISLSILPNKVDIENQYIYLLHNNLEEPDKVNYEPVPIFGDFEATND